MEGCGDSPLKKKLPSHGAQSLLPVAAAQAAGTQNTHSPHKRCHSSMRLQPALHMTAKSTACRTYLYCAGLPTAHVQVPAVIHHWKKPCAMEPAAFTAPSHSGLRTPLRNRRQSPGTCMAGTGEKQQALLHGASPGCVQVPGLHMHHRQPRVTGRPDSCAPCCHMQRWLKLRAARQ